MDQTGTRAERVTARLEAVTRLYEWPDGRKELRVGIHIDCPFCGELHYDIHGHHILGFLAALTKAAEEHPDLIGTKVTELASAQHRGRIPEDPTNN